MSKKKTIVRLIKNHKVLLSSIAILFFLWAVGATIMWWRVDEANTKRTEAYQQKIIETDRLLQQLKEKKVAEKKAEEEKKAQEAEEAEAAKQVTEEAAKNQAVSQSKGSNGCNTASIHNNPAAIDVLVNKKHCLTPLSYTPGDLVTSNGATLSAKAMDSFTNMFNDASAAGQPFNVSSSYRSYATQVSTYNYWVSVSGQAGADTYSARPGFSEHQTGFVIDVAAGGCSLSCFGGTTQYQWFQENAAKYGFIQRYYSGYESITGYVSEEWHYRYVGVAVAQDMKAKNIKTLEQYWGLEGGDYK